MTKPNDLAFPVSNRRDVPTETSVGLTKRELFAAMAMQGLCADPGVICGPSDLAKYAVEQADKLIEQLNKDQSK